MDRDFWALQETASVLNHNDKDLTKNSGLKKTNLLNEVSAMKPIWNLNKSLVLGFWQKCVYLWYTKIILMLYMLLKIIFS